MYLSKTNVENVRLCAMALGYSVVNKNSNDGSVFVTNGADHFFFNPLMNNALAMALLKKYPEQVLPALKTQIDTAANVPEMFERAANFNSTIVETVAKYVKRGLR